MRIGFWVAGLVNLLGVLLVSRGFSNSYLSELYPEVFNPFGLLVIMLWGAAYLAASRNYEAVPQLVAVFALEKVLYVASWVVWLVRYGPDLPAVWEKDPSTAAFLATYGPTDLAFAGFFGWVAWRTWMSRPRELRAEPDPGRVTVAGRGR
jgi:hypothetical protein